MKYIFKASSPFLISLATSSMPIVLHYACLLELTDSNEDQKHAIQII